jgi:hypothetical protein
MISGGDQVRQENDAYSGACKGSLGPFQKLGKKINADKLSWNERAMGPVTVSAPFALQIAA